MQAFIPENDVAASQRRLLNAVYTERLSSVEHYFRIGHEPRPVLRNINLEIKKGDTWAVTGNSRYEAKLLLEIIANIKPYHSGKCVLVERGMMRRKRIILPHVFYIGNAGMAYPNMNVLEFLMFATANSSFDVVAQQERIFEQLISFGLGKVSLSPVSAIPTEYKALVLLLAGVYSGSQLVVFNLPDLKYNNEQIASMKKVAEYMSSLEQTLVLSSFDFYMIDEVCDNIAYLYDGEIAFNGGCGAFKSRYDLLLMTIVDKNAQALREHLLGRLPSYGYTVQDNRLLIYASQPDSGDSRLIYEEVVKAGYAPNKIKINNKTIKNACEGIRRQYDL